MITETFTIKEMEAELLGIYREHEKVFRDALSMYLKYQADFRRLLSPAYIGGVAAFFQHINRLVWH